jgi:hypothetical protein
LNTEHSPPDARQQAINDAHKADWPENMTATDADVEHPTYGNAGSRLARVPAT